MRKFKTLPFSLLFDGGAAGSGAGAASGAAGEAGAPAAEQASGEVVYGKQPVTEASAAGEQKAEPKQEETTTKVETPQERKQRFKDMISGEFKAEYDADVQRILFKRLEKPNAALQAQKPIMDLLAQRYGISDADPEKVFAALNSDSEIWQREADDAGMTVEQYANYRRMERENAAFREAQQTAQARERAEQQYGEWMNQVAEMVGTADQPGKYPGFDLQTEMNGDPRFLKLLQAGIPVQDAYETIHRKELQEQLIAQTAASTEKKVADNIRAKGNRPAEAGAASQTGVTVRDDVHKLSADDRRKIAERASRGEKIFF